jgi:SAM-dependent MidA family methyltransferase
MGELTYRIKQRILERGCITFAEFMEMALYYPDLGYYTSLKEKVGARGDFYTSPATHPIFGALISIQLEQMWHLLGQPARFTVVEIGAGKGLLAHDILTYSRCLPSDFANSLEYIALERGRRQAIYRMQGEHIELSKPGPQHGMSPENITGCVLSNELLDALPTHKVTIKNGALKEVYITVKGNEFVEFDDEPSTPLLKQKLQDEGIGLSEGYCTEVNINIEPWIKNIAHILNKGFVLTIDYGYLAGELYCSQRNRGTLMSYYKHTCQDNPYVRIGEQDITSHVDFSSVIKSGYKAGLCSVRLTSQEEFLLNLGLNAFIEAMSRKGLDCQEYLANRFAMLELIRPEGMGNFKVLIQGKGVNVMPLYCFIPNNEKVRELKAERDELNVPLLTREHVPLLSAKYPQYYYYDDQVLRAGE